VNIAVFIFKAKPVNKRTKEKWDHTAYLPYIQGTFNLKMVTAMFAKMENLQHLTWLIPESRRYTLLYHLVALNIFHLTNP
jgi:hypothetical protein